MPNETTGISVDTAIETNHAESAPSVLALLTTPNDAGVKRYLHERKLARYRQRIAESDLALTRHRARHHDLERQLSEEEVKDQVEPSHR